MDKAQFWQLVEDSRNKANNCERQAAKLKKSLSRLDATEIAEFNRYFDECSILAYRWDLWGAAYLINGGASDDGFQYFRWWLIGQGQKYFEAALQNPERAADKLKNADAGDVECEELAYCINDAYKEKTGVDLPPTDNTHPIELQGERWEEDDLATLFPALWKKFD